MKQVNLCVYLTMFAMETLPTCYYIKIKKRWKEKETVREYNYFEQVSEYFNKDILAIIYYNFIIY